MFVGVVLELDEIEMQRPHEIDVYLVDDEEAETGHIKGGFQVDRTARLIGGVVQPTIAFDLRPSTVRKPGTHKVRIHIDSQLERTLAVEITDQPLTDRDGG